MIKNRYWEDYIGKLMSTLKLSTKKLENLLKFPQKRFDLNVDSFVFSAVFVV